jgi:hypothetical protein
MVFIKICYIKPPVDLGQYLIIIYMYIFSVNIRIFITKGINKDVNNL